MKNRKIINRKKKKAFTLIELLAVILILGIIALIAVPTVNNVIEDSKKGAIRTTATNLSQVAEQQCEIERINGKDITNIYTIEDGVISSYLDIKNLPSSGTIIVDDECNVTVSVVDGNYCATVEGETVNVNTNILHCGGEYVDVPKTDTNCFEFDPDTRTITGYKFDDATCPTEISIPATIDNVPVEHIGDLAFVNIEYDAIVYNAHDSDGYVFSDIVKENILKFKGFSTSGISFINYLEEEPKKYCTTTTSRVQLDIDYVVPDKDVSKYTKCAIDSSTITYVSDVGVITKVNFAPATNLKTIGMGAFMLNQITEVIFKDNTNLSSIDLNAFSRNLISGELDLSNLKLTTIGGFGSNSITKVILPNTTTTLLGTAFSSNSIEEVVFGSNITTIGNQAFSYNLLSGNMVLPETVTDIGAFSFYGNIIETLKINENLKVIPGGAFSSNSTLKSVTFGSNVENIGTGAFSYAALETLEFNEKLKIIGDNSFQNNNVSSITFNDNLESIGTYAFSDNKLSSITFNDNLESIGANAFRNNTSTIDNLVLPDSLTELGIYAFEKTKINNLTIGDNITEIKLYTFSNSGIQNVTWGSSIKTIGNYAFYNCFFKTFSLPDGIISIGAGAFQYAYRNVDNTIVTLPESLESANFSAFHTINGSNLTRINIGSKVKSIGQNSFWCSCSSNCDSACGYTIYIDQLQSESSLNPTAWGNLSATILWKESSE